MAIIVLNKSKCGICGKVLMFTDKIVGLPAYFGDPNDPLYFFHDAGFHEGCFFDHPLHEAVLSRIEYIEGSDSGDSRTPK